MLSYLRKKFCTLEWKQIGIFTCMLFLGILLILGMLFVNGHTQKLIARKNLLIVDTNVLIDTLYLLGGEWEEVELGNNYQYRLLLELDGSKEYGLYIRSLSPTREFKLFVDNNQINAGNKPQSFYYDLKNATGQRKFEIVLQVEHKNQFQKTIGIFLGTETAIRNAWNSITIQRMLAIGFCVAVIISCLLMYCTKTSEKYLVVLSILLIYTTLKIVGKAFGFLNDVPLLGVFIGSAQITTLDTNMSSYISYSISVLLVTHLRCGVFGQFMHVKISNIRYPYFVDFWCLTMGIVTLITAIDFSLAVDSIYILAFLFEAWIILRWSTKNSTYRWMFIAAWSSTFSVWLYSRLLDMGILPMGLFNGLVSFPTYHNIFYTLVFLFITNTVFGHKYQQADELAIRVANINAELETTIEIRTNDLKKSYDKLQGLLKQKDDFVQMIAHNMKTPLFTIEGYAEMIKAEMMTDIVKARNHLEHISRDIDYVKSMIDKMLLISRLENGEIQLRPYSFETSKLLRQVKETSAIKATKQGVLLLTVFPEAPIFISGDEFYLRQALQNIVDNAINSCPEGGCTEISSDTDADYVRILVRDDGCGILPEDLERIFDLYFSKTKSGNSGSGLGLAIARKIVELHNGEIQVESTPSIGSTFCILLPISSVFTLSGSLAEFTDS